MSKLDPYLRCSLTDRLQLLAFEAELRDLPRPLIATLWEAIDALILPRPRQLECRRLQTDLLSYMLNEPLRREEFQRGVIRRHQAAVDLHRDVEHVLVRGISQDRYVDQLVDRVVDMLFIQAFKSHSSTYELATLALAEDAVTIVRRSLELAVTAVYIAKDSSEDERRRRAGRFLAFLWVKWPPDLRPRVPEGERQTWDAVLREYGSEVITKGQQWAPLTPESRRWGPLWSEIFQALEDSDKAAGLPKRPYRENYSFLSNVAHGSPPSLVAHYGGGVIPIHDDRLVSKLLIFSSTYSLVPAIIWNELYHLMNDGELSSLKDRALQLMATQQGSGAQR